MDLTQQNKMHDIVIVGGGPAGLAAAVYAARLGLATAIVAGELGGQAVWASRVDNYLGFQLVSGAELTRHFREHVERFEVHLLERQFVNAIAELPEPSPAEGAAPAGPPWTGSELGPSAGQAGSELSKRTGRPGFEVFTQEGARLSARTIIIASGRAPARLAVPGERELVGRGVSYCAVCDGAFFRGRPVAVAGAGESAAEAALQLARLDAQVTLIGAEALRVSEQTLVRLQTEPLVTLRHGVRITSIEGEDQVTGLVLTGETGGEERLAVDAVFIERGSIPAEEFTGGLVAVNERGEIVVDRQNMTSCDGIFAAGDVTDDFGKQIIIAAGEGARAGMAAAQWLQRH